MRAQYETTRFSLIVPSNGLLVKVLRVEGRQVDSVSVDTIFLEVLRLFDDLLPGDGVVALLGCVVVQAAHGVGVSLTGRV